MHPFMPLRDEISSNWPDAAALICTLFALFIMNATIILIISLIIWTHAHARSFASDAASVRKWMTATYAVAAINVLSNVSLGVATKKKLSATLSFACWLMGALWPSALILALRFNGVDNL